MEEPNPFKVWDRMQPRYRYAVLATLAFLGSVAVGATDFRWATPVWAIAGLGAAFLCIYAFPSVWRYLIHLGLIYVFMAVGTVLPLFYLDLAPLFIGALVLLHILAVLTAFNLIKDVNLSRRAYHVAAAKDGKWAPYVPMGLWLLAVVLWMVLVDLSMWGFSSWAQHGASKAGYLASEVMIVLLIPYILDVPERAFGGKGADFRPRVSLSEVGAETKKVMKKLVTRSPKESSAAAVRRKGLLRRPPAAVAPRTMPEGAKSCPACGSDLRQDVRRCPECYKANDFAWCPVSEHYIIACPACGRPTVYGEDRCRHCGHGLAVEYACPSCGRATPLGRWGRA